MKDDKKGEVNDAKHRNSTSIVQRSDEIKQI